MDNLTDTQKQLIINLINQEIDDLIDMDGNTEIPIIKDYEQIIEILG